MPSRITKEAKKPRSYAETLGLPKTPFTTGRNAIRAWVEHIQRHKELEEENLKLKSMYADLTLANKMLKDVLSKKW
jgi:putative transposase